MSRVASSLIALTRVGIGRFWLSSAIYFAGRDSLMLKSCFRKSSWSIGFDIYVTSLVNQFGPNNIPVIVV
jgi:hypothetical protein